MNHVRYALIGAASLLALATTARAADPELLVFDWAGWEVPGLFAGYAEKHGTGPTYSFFADDDEAFQKVSSGFTADVVHPCSQMVPKYRAAGLIEPWDTSRIPEFKNLAPRMLASTDFVDAEGVWFLPTDYAFTAIAYNTDTVPVADVASLKVFLDPKYAGRISLPDNTDDVWALALLATGVTDWTAVTDDQFTAAADWLRQAHPNVRVYWSDPSELTQLMATGEVQVAWSWNDAVALMRSEGFPVGFQRTPTEGVTTWFCGLINMKDGPGNEDKLYDYVNSFIAPSSAQVMLDTFGYASANDAGLATIAPDALVAADVNPIEGILLPQVPIPTEMRDRMLEEFELIKSGF
ncbi:extracellular solute-binding protein [Tabrizicola sp.]|uniref:extracellular solute-binding protein n=1 Tax=Tabrizicola sp. TaxID=2005166 RepID=UPI00286C3482|nr:extracellular solute-binding protein [Tabrizicola sp.]